MKRAHGMVWVVCGMTVCGGLVGCSASKPTVAEAAEPAVALFDGVSLERWVQRGGQAVYRVEDGAIVGETRPNQPNTFLCTEAEYGDFRLMLEFNVDPALNSGVQFRSHTRLGDKGEQVYGYQAEIDPSERSWTAGIYEESGRGWLADLKQKPDAQKAFRQGEWNTMVVECKGDRLQTWLNGVPVADLVDAKKPSGFIGLQVHGIGNKSERLTVRWRNIRIEPL